MQLKIKQTILISIVFDILFIPVNNILNATNRMEKLDVILSPPGMAVILSSMFFFALITVISYTLLIKYYDKIHLIKLLIMIVLSAVPVILLRYFVEENLFDMIWGFKNYNNNYSIDRYVFDNFYYAFLYSSIGSAIYFIQRSNYNELQKKELEISNNKTELSFLRSQMNPHFLFNILNNINSLVYTKSSKSLEAIDQLSKLLRYSLYETSDEVQLSKEISYINDFINLQKMRYNYPVFIENNIEQNIEDVLIAPFILIPFVENAFKHGDLSDPNHPLRIELTVKDSELIFSVENTISDKLKDSGGGIGIDNTKKRLSLIYKENYDLKIDSTENIHKINLRLKVKKL